MQRILQRFCLLFTVVVTSIISANAQEPTDTTKKPTSVDPDLIAWQNATRPKEYTIASIKVTGVFFLDSAIVASISGLQVGDKILPIQRKSLPQLILTLLRGKMLPGQKSIRSQP